jgi:hypothetical protein
LLSIIIDLPGMSAAGMSTARVSAARKSCAVFVGGFVSRLTYVAVSIPGFITLEMRKRLRTASRHRAVISIVWIVAIVYVSIKSMRTMEPRACANKDSARKPVRSVVAIRSAIIRRVVEISIGAYRSNTDADCNLGCVRYGSFRRAAHQDKGESDKSQ